MNAKKASNSPENISSNPAEDVRGMSLRARRGIRSKRIKEMMPYLEELETALPDLPPSSEKISETEENKAQTPQGDDLPMAHHTSQDIPAPETEMQETAPAPKRRGRPPGTKKTTTSTPRKTKETKENQSIKASTQEQEEDKAPKRRGRPRKNPEPETSSAPPVENISKKEKTKARSQTKKRHKEERPSEQEEILSTLKRDSSNTSSAQELSPEKESAEQEAASHMNIEKVHSQEENFYALNLSKSILRAIDELGYTTPTKIQSSTIPHILAGEDVLGVAQTGTGKTASFILPLLEKLSHSRARARMPRSLILEPTRELALQVADNIQKYGKYLNINHALLIGGNSMNEQKDVLQRGVDVLIATPGRLIDIFERGGLLLTQTDFLVIDEADRMLDMGFIPDIEKIISLLPKKRQTLFFSATMAPTIKKLADSFLNKPQEIIITPESSVNGQIEEIVFFTKKEDKHRAIKRLLQTEPVQNAIIFCNRKKDVDLLFSYLNKHHFSVGHLHGDLDQNIRFATLERFRAQELHVLVCSDVAARGIDISGLSHVFNYDLPHNAEDYVHRIGRTGRAGNQGTAFSFVAPEEVQYLEAIEKLIQKPIEQAVLEGFETSLPDSDIVQPYMEQTLLPPKEEAPLEPVSSPEVKKATPPSTEAPIASSSYMEAIADFPTPQASYAEHGQSLPLDRNGFLPPISEKESVQKGFGEYVPSFMKISFPPQNRSFPVA